MPLVSPEWRVEDFKVHLPQENGAGSVGDSCGARPCGGASALTIALYASEISRVLAFIMHTLSSGQLDILNRPFVTPFDSAITSFDFPG